MVIEEGKPLVIVDQGGAFRDLRRTTAKGYRKSVENGAVWELDPATGRVLPYREDLSLIRMTDTDGFYFCVLLYPDGEADLATAFSSVPAAGDTGRPHTGKTTAPDSAAVGDAAPTGKTTAAVGAAVTRINAAADVTRTAKNAADASALECAGAVLSGLIDVIENRRRNRPAGSYTSYLFGQGEEKIRKKTGEEAVELILARDDTEIVHETADLIYHLLVLLCERGIGFESILGELESRAGS